MVQGNESDIDWVIKDCKYIEQRLAERLGRRAEFKEMIDLVDVPSSIRSDMHRMRMARNPLTHVEGVDRLEDRADFARRSARVREYFNKTSQRATGSDSRSSGGRHWILWVVGFIVLSAAIPSLGNEVLGVVTRLVDALLSVAWRAIEAMAVIWIPWLLWRLFRPQ